MGRVASFGSVNVDHVRYCERAWLAAQAERYDWFPAAGETRKVESVPEAFAAAFDRTFLGGKGANQTVAAAAAGADAALFGAVGADANEHAVRERLAERDVDASAVESVDGPTGAAYVAVDEATGENHIAVLSGANGAVDAAYARRHADALAGADCVVLQNELPVEAVLGALDVLADRPNRPVVVFDPAPADENAARVLAHECVDATTPNAGEADRLDAALAAFDGTIVRTRGADGAAVDPGERGPWTGEAFTVPSPTVDAVDTTGAGDVFDGYLAAALAEDRPLRDAVTDAAVAAALSTTREGVQSAVPDRERVRQYRD
ncbi:sugar kinase [Halorubellus sp. JP-L1]|uniref:PfkB family carbohydrate kinase n=1 Tax=Halorubellus sp. JP-L1 TaxID=2715753 RepID=UPI001407CBB2|nr:PfkB family carbohydrate kinase [Halorubellus sp. JP-L1]NHN41126.1 sugar kinase [Halorubellus sp. JP-L1]